MNDYYYGAVLKVQRESSLQEVCGQLDAIKQCGMNLVVIWPAVFWWESRLHPDYPFHTGKQILAYAEQIGLKVIMELAGQITSLEYAPDFWMKPEYFAQNADGSANNNKNYFDFLNYNHPEVKALVRKGFIAAAEAYKDFPALYGYDILNETMFTSYDCYTLRLFRSWLEDKYEALDKLNDIWDRAYTDWNQIEFTTWLWASVMPFVDWQQFRKWNIGRIVNEWRGYIREVDDEHPTIADNINSMIATDGFYDRPHDDWSIAANVDEFGISFYPKENLDGTTAYKRWQTFAGAQAATKGGRFWISELQSHHRSMFSPTSIVYPHELKWWTWEAVSHGAKGIVYWKWDPFIKGIQTGGRGLVDGQGARTPRADAAADMAQVIGRCGRELSTYRRSRPYAAIVYDKLTHDFTKAFTLNVPQETNFYVNTLAGLYRCLWDLNIPVTFITPDDVIDGAAEDYRALFLPSQLVMGDKLAQALESYAERGGTVIADGKFAELDENGIMHQNQPGGPLQRLLGVRLADIDPLHLDMELVSEASDVRQDEVLPGYFERKLLRKEDERGNVLAAYADGAPGLLEVKCGKGALIYASTHLWYGYYHNPSPQLLQWLSRLSRKLVLAPYAIENPSIKVNVLQGEDGLLLFAFNYEDEMKSSWLTIRAAIGEVVSVRAVIGDKAVPFERDADGRLRVRIELPRHEVEIYKVEWRTAR
ncbi:beta-galactosidase [Paenibacillus athensensis]|uniref:beta-galactosidase n=1 Tax=Paenibacillus athensensis TaxID=1967502 RepID=A0A4Y8PXD1_9BACL|nr:beta-galactosidase [Paenibacillus athensensis]MCD1259899.1 beta-galactosidase [Paenibacillus athensensis]